MMQKVLLFVFGLIALSLASDVVDLTNQDIDAALAENQFLLLELFAPWCGHCKNLAPEYEKAATEVKADGITLAKIDATADQAAGQRFGVRGYPTLIWFKNGQRKEYKGPRDASGIASWVRKNSLPTITVVSTADELAAIVDANAAVVVAYIAEDDEKRADLDTVADSDPMADVRFVVATGAAQGENAGKIVVHRQFDDDVEFEGEWELGAFAAFVAAEGFPYFSDAMTSWTRVQATRPVILLVCFDVDADKETMQLGNEIAKEFRADYAAVYANKEVLPKLESFGLKAADGVPNAVVISNVDGMKYPFPKSEQEFNRENIRAWLSGIKDGSVKPLFKSEPIPESNDAPVTVLVGDSFKDIVFAEGKDVLVEFYAPWCGHCKNLAPVYDQLGEHYANDGNVVIAKMDSTANDNPVVQIQGFPTLYFFPAGNDEGVKYSSGRDLDSFVSFIEANRVSSPAEPAAKAEGHDEL